MLTNPVLESKYTGRMKWWYSFDVQRLCIIAVSILEHQVLNVEIRIIVFFFNLEILDMTIFSFPDVDTVEISNRIFKVLTALS